MYEGLLRSFLAMIYIIHNKCHPFGPISETIEQILPGFLSFFNLALQLFYNAKTHIKLTGKHTSRTLANIV